MDRVRYYAALYLLMAAPGAILYWFSIHPFIRFWRKVGARRTVFLHYGLIVAVAIGVFQIRKPLLSVEFGTHPALVAVAVVWFAATIVMGVITSKHLKKKILWGIPELDPERQGVPLLTQGSYSRVRHPRYLQVMLSFFAWSLFTNYLANYVLAALTVIVLLVVISMEEKELRERYGAAYDDYCARVPRLIPRFTRSH